MSHGHGTVVQQQTVMTPGDFSHNPWKLASFGELDTIKSLIEAGVHVDESDEMGFSPLALAARNNHDKVVSLLIENGSDVNGKSFAGMRPLHHGNLESKRSIITQH
jgi:ankyrin repeat protein